MAGNKQGAFKRKQRALKQLGEEGYRRQMSSIGRKGGEASGKARRKPKAKVYAKATIVRQEEQADVS